MEKDVNIGEYLGAYANQALLAYAYFFVGFLTPFTLGHPQLLVGVIVNATLVLSALHARSARELIPLLCAPSLGVLARGLIFGPMTPFLVIMVPFIWAGNAIMVVGIKELYGKGTNYWITLAASSAAKSGFLFAAAFALFSLSLVPAVFLETMGATQLVTALAGGILAFGLHKAARSKGLC